MKRLSTKIKERASQLISKNTTVFGLDMAYFMKGGFWLYVAYATGLIRSLVLGIVFANLLSKEVFGQYTFILSILSIAAIFGIPGLRIGIIRAVSRGDEATYIDGIKTAFRWSWLGSVGLAGIAIYSALIGRETGVLSFAIVAVLLPWYTSTSMYDTLLIGSHRYKHLAIISSTINMVLLCTTLAAVLIHPKIPTILLASLGVQVLLQIFVVMYLQKKVMRSNTKKSKEDIKYGHQVQLINVLSAITEYGGMVLMPAFAGFTALASYAIAYKIPQIATNFLKVPVDMFLPKLANSNTTRTELRRHFLRLLTISLAMIVFLNFAVIPLALKYVFPTYADVHIVATALSLIVLTIPNTLVSDYLNSKRKVKLVLTTSISIRIASVILLAALLPTWGIWAVVMSQVFPRMAHFIFNTVYLFMPERESTPKAKNPRND